MLVNPADAGVAKALVEIHRRLDVAHVDANVGHAKNLGLITPASRLGDGALLELQVNPIGIAHKHKAIAGGAVGLSQKNDTL